LKLTTRPTQFDLDAATFDPPQCLQALFQSRNLGLTTRIACSKPHQNADPPHPLGLLSTRGARPRNHRATNNGNELPPPHVQHPRRAKAMGP
jgi:hypothetical protein